MPRQARLDVPGALHHIMVRGINKSAIFEDDQDRTRFLFLEKLDQVVREGKCRKCTVYAWVLMGNHVHILFKSGKDGRHLSYFAQIQAFFAIRTKSVGRF